MDRNHDLHALSVIQGFCSLFQLGSSQARQTRSTVLEILILFGAFSIVLKPNIVDTYYTRSIFHQPREVKLVNEAHAIQQGSFQPPGCGTNRKVARQWLHKLNRRPSTPSYRCSRSDLYLLEADQDQSYASNHYPQTWNRCR